MVTRGQRSALVLLLILAASLYLVNFDKSIVSSASLTADDSPAKEQPLDEPHSSFVKRSILQSDSHFQFVSPEDNEGHSHPPATDGEATTGDIDAPGDADSSEGATPTEAREEVETSQNEETSTTQGKGENVSSDDNSQSAAQESIPVDQNNVEQTVNSQLEPRESTEQEKSSTDPQVPSENTASTDEGSTNDDDHKTTDNQDNVSTEIESKTTFDPNEAASTTTTDDHNRSTSDADEGATRVESETVETTKQTDEARGEEILTSTTNEQGESSPSETTGEEKTSPSEQETTTNNEGANSFPSESSEENNLNENTESISSATQNEEQTSQTEPVKSEEEASTENDESTPYANPSDTQSETESTGETETTVSQQSGEDATSEDISSPTGSDIPFETTKQTESVNSFETDLTSTTNGEDESSQMQTTEAEASTSLEEQTDSQKSSEGSESTTNEQDGSSSTSEEKTSPTIDEEKAKSITSNDNSNENTINEQHAMSYVRESDAIGGPSDSLNGNPFLSSDDDSGPRSRSEEAIDGEGESNEQISTSSESESNASSGATSSEMVTEEIQSTAEDSSTQEGTSPAEAVSTEGEVVEETSAPGEASSSTESEQTETSEGSTSDAGATVETSSSEGENTNSESGSQSSPQTEETSQEETSPANETKETSATAIESASASTDEDTSASNVETTKTDDASDGSNEIDSDQNQSSLLNENTEEEPLDNSGTNNNDVPVASPGNDDVRASARSSDDDRTDDETDDGTGEGEGESNENTDSDETEKAGSTSETEAGETPSSPASQETTEPTDASSEAVTEATTTGAKEESTGGTESETSETTEEVTGEVKETTAEGSSESDETTATETSSTVPEGGTTDAATPIKEDSAGTSETGSEIKLDVTESVPNFTDETESTTSASEQVSTGEDASTTGGEETESTESESTGGESTSAPTESATGEPSEAIDTVESSSENENETETTEPGQTSSASPPEETTTVNNCGSEHGCCGDGKTPAKGPDEEGCTCDASKFGCCPDRLTAARGPDNEGCPCHTMQYGCCPNSTQAATGTKYAGCPCTETPHGCCPDGLSVSFGPNYKGCDEGEPMDTRLSGEACALPKERGPGRNYTVNWYFDMTYGGCIRFWYGGREGNANRFQTQEECERTCVSPEGAEVCSLPKVEGPCDGKYSSFYFNKQSGKCETFDYGGCLGNKNRFDTEEACKEVCHSKPTSEDPCDQPVVVGPCRGNLWRWYFNKQEGRCKSFVYSGCEENKNNFKSEADCMTTCSAASPGELCKLGKAEGPCLGHYPRWFYDYLDSSCKEFIYSGCEGNRNQFVDKSSCERTCNQTQVVAKTDVCALPVDKGPCGGNMLRWYFDKRLRRCERFHFGGCEGNINNFGSQSDCERACLVSTQEQNVCLLQRDPGNCTRHSGYNFGEERWYYDSSDKRCHRMYYSGCNGNGNNFRSHDECFSRCGQPFAPSEQNVDLTLSEFKTEYCSLPRDSGPCKNNEIKWWYDQSDGVCKEFYYGGCNGNLNRFNSKRECELKCWNSQDICNLRKVRGPCSGNFIQWYFDRARNACFDFAYSGCSGNANRFSAKETCESYCKKKHANSPLESENAIASGSPQKDPSCNAPVDPGTCQSYLPRYYYDQRENLCRTFIYTGCGGNINRFETRRECEKRCVTSAADDGPDQSDDKEVVCKAQVDAGPCMESHARWFYDPTSYTCLPFIYGGCHGNKNRFKTFEVCIQFCYGVNNHRPEVTQAPTDFNFEEATRSQRPLPPVTPAPVPVTQAPLNAQPPVPQQTSWPVTSPPTTTTTQGKINCNLLTRTCFPIVADLTVSFLLADPCRYECADLPFFDDCKLFVENRYCNNEAYAKACCRSCVQSGQLTLDEARKIIIPNDWKSYTARDEGRRWCFYEN